MNRDEVVMTILPTMLQGANNLAALSDERRKELFAIMAKFAYEIADAVVEASVIIPEIED